LEAAVAGRYAGWDGELGSSIMDGGVGFPDLEARVLDGAINPVPVSGRQEDLETLVNRTMWRMG
jgi:xylose isomerase